MKPKISLKLDTAVPVTDADIQSPRHQVPEEYQKNSKSSDKEDTEDSQTNLDKADAEPFKPREISIVHHNDEATVQPLQQDSIDLEKPKVVDPIIITKPADATKVETQDPPPNLITQVSKEQPLVTPVPVVKPKQSFWSRLCCCVATEEPTEMKAVALEVPPLKHELSDIKLLPPPSTTKKCLVLDLDETLVHSSFKPVDVSDFTIQVEIENHVYTVYVLKRPGVEEFLNKVAEWFEVVVFTASLAKYADPVLDRLDPNKTISHRLFRESCVQYRGNYVKDLSQLGRDLKSAAIVDNSPICYMFHPNNAIPIVSWFDDPDDKELDKLLPYLEKMAKSDEIPKFITTEERQF